MEQTPKTPALYQSRHRIATIALATLLLTAGAATSASALTPPVPSQCCITVGAPIASDVAPYGLRPPPIHQAGTRKWHRHAHRASILLNAGGYRFVVAPRIAP